MFSIHHLKSAGPDGIIAEFFHVHWEIVGSSVLMQCTSFLLKQFNTSLLVMLPKVDCPEVVAHFWPISLCNTIYKCITKCMVNRMKGSQPYLIMEFARACDLDHVFMEDFVCLICVLNPFYLFRCLCFCEWISHEIPFSFHLIHHIPIKTFKFTI